MPNRLRPCHFIGASLAVLALVAPGVALAEPAADSSSSLIESVTVTAQKRVQNPIEVPMALTAYNGEFLEKINVQEFDKLSLFVPGFVVQNQSPNNPGLSMRGLNLDSGEAAQEPRVSVFEDGVSISTTRATYIELFDIERVEVARGPQTTLFGRSALMGGVNVIQNKAKTDGFAAGGAVEFGDNAYRMIEGMVNLPVDSTLALRAAARYKSRDGYVDDLNGAHAYNSVGTFAGRASLAWKPTENFSADLIFNFERDRTTGTAFKSGSFLPSSPTGTILGDLSPNSGATLTQSIAGFEGGKNIGLNRKVWDVKALTEYKINSALTLSNITAYRRFDSLEVFDPDGFVQPMLQSAEDERGDQFSHETRINYMPGGKLSAFAGISYFYSNVSQRVPLQFDERMLLALVTGQNAMLQTQSAGFFDTATFKTGYAPAMVQGVAFSKVYAQAYAQLLPIYGATVAATQANAMATNYVTANAASLNAIAAGLKGNHWEQSINYGKTKSVDLYADVTYKLFDDLELNAGARYTTDDKQTAYAGSVGDTSYLGIFLAGVAPSAGWGILGQPSANNGDKIGQDFSDDGLSWRFSLRYALADNANLYATYARGRRPKVLSTNSPATPFGAPVFEEAPAENVDSFEIGAKTALLDNTLRIDTSFYFYDYSNFQSTQLDNNKFVTFNAGKAEAYGFEGTVDWTVNENLDLFGTLTASRARFVGASLFHGNQFRLNPDVKFSLGGSLHHGLFGGTISFLPTYTWQSKIFFDDNNDIASEQNNFLPDTKQDELQKAYGLLNLRLAWEPDQANWRVSAFVSNVLDQKYIKDAGNAGDNLGIPTFIGGEPRFFGAALSFKLH